MIWRAVWPDAVPESLRAFGRDLESNFKAVLQAQLGKLDLVSRQNSMCRPPFWRAPRQSGGHGSAPERDRSASSRRSRSLIHALVHGLSTALSRAPAGSPRPRFGSEVLLGPDCRRLPWSACPRPWFARARSGFAPPCDHRLWVSRRANHRPFSPADLPKEGGRFDLPIAVGILAAERRIAARAARGTRVLRRAVARAASCARRRNCCRRCSGSRSGRELILPAANALEAAWSPMPRCAWPAIYGRFATHSRARPPVGACPRTATSRRIGHRDIRRISAEVRGQFAAKRALGDRSGRRAWTADDRASRCRQNPARATPARVVAAADGARALEVASLDRPRDAAPLGGRTALSQSAAYRFGRSTDRRRRHATRRTLAGASGSPVPRRAAGIRAQRLGGVARTVGKRRGHCVARSSAAASSRRDFSWWRR